MLYYDSQRVFSSRVRQENVARQTSNNSLLLSQTRVKNEVPIIPPLKKYAHIFIFYILKICTYFLKSGIKNSTSHRKVEEKIPLFFFKYYFFGCTSACAQYQRKIDLRTQFNVTLISQQNRIIAHTFVTSVSSAGATDSTQTVRYSNERTCSADAAGTHISTSLP